MKRTFTAEIERFGPVQKIFIISVVFRFGHLPQMHHQKTDPMLESKYNISEMC